MKKRVLENLKKMRDPTIRNYKNYLEEAIEYVENTEEPNKRLIDADWLLRRITDDFEKRTMDGLFLTKVLTYIHEYETKKDI